MPRYYVRWQTLCTWGTDIEAESQEAAEALVNTEGWIPSDCEIIAEEDHGPTIVEEMIDA